MAGTTEVLSAFADYSGTVSSTPLSLVSFGFAAADVAKASRAVVSANVNGVNVILVSGSTASATKGHPVSEGTSIQVNGRADLDNFRMVRTGSDATVTVTLWA